MALRFSNVAGAVLAACLAACAGYTAPIARNEAPTAGSAYLHGRFRIEVPKSLLGIDLGLDGYQTMGQVFTCADGAKYTVRFSRDTPLQVLRLNPSTCSLTEIVFSNGDGMASGRKPLKTSMLQNIDFRPGRAYYIGDYEAKAERSHSGNVTTMSWDIEKIADTYRETTAAMRAQYPALAGVPTENKLNRAGSSYSELAAWLLRPGLLLNRCNTTDPAGTAARSAAFERWRLANKPEIDRLNALLPSVALRLLPPAQVPGQNPQQVLQARAANKLGQDFQGLEAGKLSDICLAYENYLKIVDAETLSARTSDYVFLSKWQVTGD